MIAPGRFYSTWEAQPTIGYPRAVLERHTALCRYFDLPENTHPAGLPPVDAKADDYAAAAVALSDQMFAWCPDEYDASADAFTGMYDGPGHFDHYVLYGGRGGMKSTGIADALVFHARSRKEVIVCARQFQNSIDTSSKALIEAAITKAGATAEFVITDQDIKHIGTGSEFTFLGLDRNVASIKSRAGITIVWVEEAEVVKLKALQVLMPTVRESGSRFYWSFNPDREDSAVDDHFRPSPPERTRIYCVNVENNPWLYRTRMPSEMRSHWRKKNSTFKHVWRGDYNRNSETRLVPAEQVTIGYAHIPEHIRPVYGMDFGTRDPQVLLRVYVVTPEDVGADPEEHRTTIYIAGEAYEVGSKIRHLPTFLNRVHGAGRNGNTIVADNSRPDLIEEMNAAGFDTLPCKKGPGSIKAGLDYISDCDIIISPEAIWCQREITKARWDTDPIGRVLDVLDASTGDHCLDALRYAVQQYQFAAALQGGRPTSSFKILEPKVWHLSKR